MKKIILILMAFLTVFLFGCKSLSFDEGAAKIAEINAKYGANMESYPADEQSVSAMISEFRELQKLRISDGKIPFDLALNYRILSLESAELLLKAQSFGSVGVTSDGFSCKPKPLIIEAAGLRNRSAQKSFEAVSVLRELAEKYPEHAGKLSLSLKTALFQNATAYKVWEQAVKDSRTIERFCPDEKVLDFYKEEFRSKGIMSEEEINALDYDAAVKKWREIRGK